MPSSGKRSAGCAATKARTSSRKACSSAVNPNSTSAPDGDGAVLQDQADAGGVGQDADVGEEIAGDGDQVGALALLERLQHRQSLPPVGMIGESIADMKRVVSGRKPHAVAPARARQSLSGQDRAALTG